MPSSKEAGLVSWIYNTFMQFQVPQFIETEDKIVGPFTLRQFLYVAAAGLLSAILYFTVATWLWLIFTIIFLGLAIGVSFIKVAGRPLGNVIFSAFGFYWNPQTYIWKSREQAAALIGGRSQEEGGISLEKLITGAALHKRWENLQVGRKTSNGNATENKMTARYQIVQKVSGERKAVRRVDYR
jgi:PrgI family protein